MKAVLAIVGCGARLEVALAHETAPAPGLIALAGPTPRSELVMAAIDLLLRSAGLSPRDLTAIATTRGPGSFTGIRVALATAQGLARALGTPAYGVPSLTMLAARTPAHRRVAVQAARRGWVYLQTFADRDGRPEPVDEPRAERIDALVALRDPVVAAEGIDLPPTVDRAPTVRSSAEALLDLVDGSTLPASSLTPLYLEPPPAAVPGTGAA